MNKALRILGSTHVLLGGGCRWSATLRTWVKGTGCIRINTRSGWDWARVAHLHAVFCGSGRCLEDVCLLVGSWMPITCPKRCSCSQSASVGSGHEAFLVMRQVCAVGSERQFHRASTVSKWHLGAFEHSSHMGRRFRGGLPIRSGSSQHQKLPCGIPKWSIAPLAPQRPKCVARPPAQDALGRVFVKTRDGGAHLPNTMCRSLAKRGQNPALRRCAPLVLQISCPTPSAVMRSGGGGDVLRSCNITVAHRNRDCRQGVRTKWARHDHDSCSGRKQQNPYGWPGFVRVFSGHHSRTGSSRGCAPRQSSSVLGWTDGRRSIPRLKRLATNPFP